MKMIIRSILTGLMIILTESRAELVNHVIVSYTGDVTVTFIDSMDNQSVFCNHPVDGPSEIAIEDVYFIYNDFGKMFYISPSLQYRMDYIEQYGGELVTVDGREFEYSSISFNRNMRQSMVYVITVLDSFVAVPLLEVHRIDTDLAFMERSVRKGFYTAIGGFLTATTFQIIGDYFGNRESGVPLGRHIAILSGAVWDQGSDLLPKAEIAGLTEHGVTYQSLTFLTPLATMGWMAYDYFFEKKTNYIRPMTTSEPFGKTMKVVTFKNMIKEYIQKTHGG